MTAMATMELVERYTLIWIFNLTMKFLRKRKLVLFLGITANCLVFYLLFCSERPILVQKPLPFVWKSCLDPRKPSANHTPFVKVIVPTTFDPRRTYLRPTNTLFPELSIANVSANTKRQIEDIIRSGVNLRPYTTELGEAAWIENGIVYRPWRKPDPSTMHKTHPSPYFTEYEPYVPFNEKSFFEDRTPDPKYKTDKKIILWHTPTRYAPPIDELQPLKACPEFPCQITTNRNYTDDSAAMIMTGQIMKSSPPRRKRDQVFVFHNHEPPYQNRMWTVRFEQPEWKHAFNWTMTYRMDSDFVVPYGIVRKRPKSIENKDYKSIVSKKDKKVAWLVSNCETSSLRNQYVNHLKKYIDVDVYGGCGNLKCPHENDDKCAEIIATRYKFYLSLESSFCKDYVTEKLFHYLTMDTIVVVRGSDQYFQHVPEEIILNTAKFDSPEELAQRIQYLDQNDDAYIAMLKEKDKYTSLVEGFPVRKPNGYIRFMAYRFESVSICLMCQRLWNLDRYTKTISDIDEWFSEKLCHKPCDIR